MTKRTCSVDGCERQVQGRGMCVTHYSAWYRQQNGRDHEQVTRTCVVCGSEWRTRRRGAKFCSDSCKGQHYSATMRTRCALPQDHPVIAAMEGMRLAEDKRLADALDVERQERLAAWRTPRECPGCGCHFTPLYTPNMLACSKRCGRRVARWRRRAAEVNAPGSFTWSDFMRIAQRFDFRCAYCGERDGQQLDPDHVVPLSRGGYNSTANLLPSCRACNADKRDLLLDEWCVDRERRGLPPRMTSWATEDRRYAHLTQAVLTRVA